MADEKNGTKMKIIWWLVGILQVVFFAFGAYALTNIPESKERIAVVEAKQEASQKQYERDIKDIKEDIRDIKDFLLNSKVGSKPSNKHNFNLSGKDN